MSLPAYGVAFGAAFILVLLLTPVARRLAIRWNIQAHPVARSVHRTPLPYLGGVAIYLGVAGSLLLTSGWSNPAVRAIVLVGGAVMLLGLWDDARNLKPSVKLLGQIAAGLAVVAMGIRIEWLTNPAGGMVILGAMAAPLTLFWVVALINVMNLIDGLDGLAAGIAGIASLTLMVAAFQTGQTAAAVLLAAVAGGALGFLPYNFNPARIIMGDAGSMFLGFALAVLAVQGMLKGPAALALAVPVLALGLPIADTFLAIVRRLRQGRSISAADREHVHHRLLQLGLSHRDAVIVMYIISGWLGISALAVTNLPTLQGVGVVTFVVVTGYFLAHRLGVLSTRTSHDVKGEQSPGS